MFLILIGAPGSGKGTQADLLSEELGLPRISTGDLFREEMRKGTELGESLAQIMESGHLVPDEVTMEVFSQRLSQPDCENGALLDGVPRTINQANDLDLLFLNDIENGKINHVMHIHLPDQEIIDRITGRWECEANGHAYHEKYNPPKEKGICDEDGSVLYQRDDQKEETVKERIKVYKESTKPLINHYKSRGLLREINGDQSIDKVHKDIMKAIGQNS